MTLRISRDGEAFDRKLVLAGRNDAPARGAEERALAALGVASAASVGAGAVQPVAKAGLGWTATTKALAGIVGLVAGGLAMAALRPVAAPSVDAVPAASAPIAITPSASPSARPMELPVAPAPEVQVQAGRVAVRVAAKPAPAGKALASEIALVQQATRALASDEPGVALSVLDTYRSLYPRGALAGEAGMLRVRCLVRLGDAAQARALAQRLLDADPHGVLAPRLREVISGGT